MKPYEVDQLIAQTARKLKKICQKKKIPYIGLNKQKMSENISAYTKGLDFPNKAKEMDWSKMGNGKFKVSIHIRRFCYEYAARKKSLTHEKWAKRYEVSLGTISYWLSQKSVKELVVVFETDHEKRIKERFTQEEESVIEELLKIVRSRKITDVKRKAINDFFGYQGRSNVNLRNINITQRQQQAQAVTTGVTINNVTEMSDTELEAELKELEEIEGR